MIQVRRRRRRPRPRAGAAKGSSRRPTCPYTNCDAPPSNIPPGSNPLARLSLLRPGRPPSQAKLQPFRRHQQAVQNAPRRRTTPPPKKTTRGRPRPPWAPGFRAPTAGWRFARPGAPASTRWFAAREQSAATGAASTCLGGTPSLTAGRGAAATPPSRRRRTARSRRWLLGGASLCTAVAEAMA